MAGEPAVTLDNIDAMIRDIDALSFDFEAAHIKEDRLWEGVLESIANGCDQPEKLARIALESRMIKFARVCA